MNPRPRKLRLLRWMPDRWIATRGPGGAPALHLTFDDGPHPEHTPRLLDLLAEHGATATFFVIGREAERHPALVQRMVAEGHRLGNHSWSHPQFDRIPLDAQREEMARTDALLQCHDGEAVHDWRTPRGVLPRPFLRDCIRRGKRIAFWSYDTLDYGRPPVDTLVAVARRHPPRAREILLMHDDSHESHGLLQAMLPEWRARGFLLRALDPMDGESRPDAAPTARGAA